MACPHHHIESKKSKKWSFWSALLLVVLPKCPYCFVAYSSAISICGLPTQNTYHWEHLLILGLISIIAVSLLKRYRGKQTWIAMTVLVLGSLLIWLSVAQGLIQGYYWGAGLIFLSTLINRKIIWSPALV